jgi:hypothetical protein
MSKPAFIIDGFTEKGIVQKLCPGRPISRTDLNGKNVTLPAMAKRIATLIRLLGNRCYPIIILIDKEQREANFAEIADELRAALVDEGVTDQDLRIGVADRMIENWTLADWERLGGTDEKPGCTDGIHGAGMIRTIKGSYNKTTDGVEYFIDARQETIYANSPSYRHFIDQLHDIECQYLNFEKPLLV